MYHVNRNMLYVYVFVFVNVYVYVYVNVYSLIICFIVIDFVFYTERFITF